MAEQLKLFEDIIDNLGKPKKPDPTVPTKAEEVAGMKQLEKYATQPDSRGAWKKFVSETEKANAPAPRVENITERIERQLYLYEDAPKPKHYDNPMIVDSENFKKPPKEFKSDDKSTYPADRNQRQRISTWDLMVQTAKTPLEKREIRDVLHRDYKNSKGANMSDKELRMINKHPDQIKKFIAPVVSPTPVPYVAAPVIPQIPIEELIKQRADYKLKLQQQDHDMQFGRGGLAHLLRPKK